MECGGVGLYVPRTLISLISVGYYSKYYIFLRTSTFLTNYVISHSLVCILTTYLIQINDDTLNKLLQ